MKNDGTFFQQTPIGKYYPDKIIKWRWKGNEFFVSPVIIKPDSMVDVEDIHQDPFIFVVTHKETGFSVGGRDNNSTSIEEAKLCAEVALNRAGEDKFKEAVKKALGMQI